MNKPIQPKIPEKNSPTATALEHFTTSSVRSKDGTSIGYVQIGHGQGVVLVQGAMGTALNFTQLAEALANEFTVYVPDRRGRGLSPLPYSKDYTIQKDIEDLEALITKTGARYIFGLSSGAIIALQAALTLPSIQKAAIYEPPLFVDGLPTALLTRYEQEMNAGKLSAALLTAMQATQMGPAFFNFIPHWLLEPLANRMMTQEDKQATSETVTMRKLAPSLRYDFHVVAGMNGKYENFKAISAEVLLLGGGKSPAFLKADLDALEKVLPNATRISFHGLGHSAAWNYEKQRNPGGQPAQVAETIAEFFIRNSNERK
jgi:pimeloyl-ACP methyl ester carboxylesterase